MILELLAGLSLAIWIYLVFGRGGYWRAAVQLEADPPAPARWPAVTALVPARNEAETIGPAVASLLAQDYPGSLRVIVIDDDSDDGTAGAARAAAEASGAADRVTVVAARALPPDWSGKLWALDEGLKSIEAINSPYLWLSDADVVHGPSILRRLVAKAEAEQRDLVSLMVALACDGPWGRLLIPAFVYFFQLLYPFPWVADPGRREAAAAGGCVLLRRAALINIGGFAAIREALIDDCALARKIKDARLSPGGIWLGLTRDSRSIRAYKNLFQIWRMVARNAFAQLRFSPLLLISTLLGLGFVFLVPPLSLAAWPLGGPAWAAGFGLLAWLLMMLTFRPTLSLYRQPAWLSALLPLAAALYGAMTVDSARRHRAGRGGAWKGRIQAHARPRGGTLAGRRPDL
ncbi:MAG TPA: glycosyltransferase [Kiloniellales bacterium]|nr:glycosyltransferase [Kiloniellales bacterium]